MTDKASEVVGLVNQNLQDALATLITKTVSGVEAASGFLQEQVPDVIHQLLVWKAMQAGIAATSCLIGIVLIAYLLNKMWKRWTFNNNTDLGMALATMLGAIATVFMFAGFYANALEVTQIVVAPKVWLIEYAAELVKATQGAK